MSGAGRTCGAECVGVNPSGDDRIGEIPEPSGVRGP